MPQKTYKKRLQVQITIYFLLLVILIINSVGWFLYFRARHYFDDELGNKLIGIALSSSDFMDADLLTYVKPGDESGNFYHSLQRTLTVLKNDFRVNRIYVVDRLFNVLVDTYHETRVGSTIPHLQSNLVELNNALDGQNVYSTLYRGYEGHLYKSAFVPIRNKNGKIVAIVGVDASPGFLQVIDKIEDSILVINLISLIVAIILSVLLARSIVNPVKKLVTAAQRISNGDYSQPVSIPSRNEIGFLGQVFNSMQENIKSSHGKLEKLKQLAEAEADSIKTYNDYILQSIANGILTIDLRGKIAVVNAEAARILQLNAEKSINKNFQQVFEQNHPFYPILKQTIEATAKSNFVETTLDFPESSISVAIQTSPLLDSNQQIIGTNWVFTDLTEIRKLQEQIKEKERLAYLGELSAAVAHEIRNPLNSIELFIGLVKRKLKEQPEQIDAINRIQQEISALNTIVTDFLIFARPSELIYQSINLSKLFQETLFLAGNELKKNKIKVHVNLPPNDISFEADANQLKQALLNIVLNSIQAMNSEGELILAGKELTKDGEKKLVQLQISDNGKGIPASDLERIFQPFYSTRSQGTGLGLAIVHNIVSAHYGTIVVKSKINQGTTVIVELPKKYSKEY